MMINDTIDAVILWVDGEDPKWIMEKNKYSVKINTKADSSLVRYRDWGLLKYWFRAIEKNMPWINRVYFITNGQYPRWLNFDCPKLSFVKHSDYMPEEFLPTFNSNSIELNIHRIHDLSDKFILFNDDTYAMNFTKKEDFFRAGYPVYPAALHSIVPLGGKNKEIMSHIYVNNMTIINRNFKINEVKRNWWKWFNPTKVGIKNAIMSAFLVNHAGFVGFYNHHLPVPFRKETLSEVWKKESKALYDTSMNKFRSSSDVSQYLFRYWELAKQTFVPINEKKLGSYYVINADINEMSKILTDYKGKLICLNDSDISEMEKVYTEEIKKGLQTIMESKFPNKSMFEI